MTVALHVRLSEFIVESRHTEISYQLSGLVRLGSQQAALNIVTELMFQWVFYLIICSPWHDTESLPPSLSQPSISSWNLGGVNVCQRSPGGHFVNDGNYLQPAPPAPLLSRHVGRCNMADSTGTLFTFTYNKIFLLLYSAARVMIQTSYFICRD